MTFNEVLSHGITAVTGATSGVAATLFARRKNRAEARKVEADTAQQLVVVSKEVVDMLERNMERMQAEMDESRRERRELRKANEECVRDRRALHTEIAALRQRIEGLQAELAQRR